MSTSVNLDTSKLDAILRSMDSEAAAALNDAGTDLEAMVKSEVDAMGVVDTGRLRDSVEWRSNGTSGVLVVGAKSDRGFPYPIAQHEGWTDRGGNWHAGRPFMRSAVEKFKGYFARNYFGRLFD